ncbi:hypothetical protein QQG55_16010 [Brugia pahangi]
MPPSNVRPIANETKQQTSPTWLIDICLERVLETNLRQTSNDVLPRLHDDKSTHLLDASYEIRQPLNFLPSHNRKTTNTHFTTYHCLCFIHIHEL